MQDVPFSGREESFQAYPGSKVVGPLALKIVGSYSGIFEHLAKIRRATRDV